jgi:F-type H+/Na+-transporting ATPase subunit alpha
MTQDYTVFNQVINQSLNLIETVVRDNSPQLEAHEIGIVKAVGDGIAKVEGLPGVQVDEIVNFPQNLTGMAFNLDRQEIGVILLGHSENLKAGDVVKRTGRVLDVPVGFNLVGRVITPTGQPLDNLGIIKTDTRLPIEREAKGIMDRSPVTVPTTNGFKSNRLPDPDRERPKRTNFRRSPNGKNSDRPGYDY